MTTAIYLDLGGALAAFGLIFAVYQLRKESWTLVLLIRNRWQRGSFWIFGCVGLFLTMVGVLIANIPGSARWPVNLGKPLIYDLAAFACFALSPISLLYFSQSTRGLFNHSTARRFYLSLESELSRANDQRIDAVLSVLLPNFRLICIYAGDKRGSCGEYARAILDVVLSDNLLANVLATKRLDALRYIFTMLAKQNVTKDIGGLGAGRIIHSLLTENDSFLFKHRQRSGLALSSDAYRFIFDSPEILAGFDIFDYPGLDYRFAKGIDVDGIEVYIKALSRSVTTYFSSGSYINPRHINNGLSRLSEIFANFCDKIRSMEHKTRDLFGYADRDEWWALHLIVQFLGHGYAFLAGSDARPEILEREKNSANATFYSDACIGEGIAEAMFQVLVALSSLRTGNQSYTSVAELMHGLIYSVDLEPGYRKPFEQRLWNRIGINVKRRWYPAVLRVYLQLLGFLLISGTYKQGVWIAEEVERVRRLLYIDLKPLFDAGAEMIDNRKMQDALLPDSMTYENGDFYYKDGSGIRHVVKPPAFDASSALLDLDLYDLS